MTNLQQLKEKIVEAVPEIILGEHGHYQGEQEPWSVERQIGYNQVLENLKVALTKRGIE